MVFNRRGRFRPYVPPETSPDVSAASHTVGFPRIRVPLQTLLWIWGALVGSATLAVFANGAGIEDLVLLAVGVLWLVALILVRIAISAARIARRLEHDDRA